MIDRVHREKIAEWLAIALVVSLPLSTSGTGIIATLWFVAVLMTLDIAEVRRVLAMPAAWLPLALLLLGALGMLWSEASPGEKWRGFDSFIKLAALPLLLIQFRRSRYASWALIAYIMVCGCVLILSMAFTLAPKLYWRDPFTFPAPFKNVPTQSGEFVACIFVLLFLIVTFWREGRRHAASLLALLAAGFLGDIAFSATGRTSLVIAIILIPVFGFRMFSRKGVALIVLGAIGLGAVLWASSPYLQQRTIAIIEEIQAYRTEGSLTSSGERLEFWKKSISAFHRAPLFGHGTGAIQGEMRREIQGQSGPYATATPNPHQQSLAIALQLGLVGLLLLWAMWGDHLSLFRGVGLAAWVGLVVVVQNVVGSLFNSHLFDFTQGWTYVVGVGIAGGVILRDLTPDEGRQAA